MVWPTSSSRWPDRASIQCSFFAPGAGRPVWDSVRRGRVLSTGWFVFPRRAALSGNISTCKERCERLDNPKPWLTKSCGVTLISGGGWCGCYERY